MSIRVTRPLQDEYEQGFANYIALVPDIEDAGRVLGAQRDELVRLVGGLGDQAAEYRYAPDKWSIKELLGHVCDTERIFGYRLLRIGRGDTTPLAGFEEGDYARAAGSNSRPMRDLVDEWIAVRNATITLVKAIPAHAWPLRGTSNGHRLTTRALLYAIVGHAAHHMNVLQTRYGVAA